MKSSRQCVSRSSLSRSGAVSAIVACLLSQAVSIFASSTVASRNPARTRISARCRSVVRTVAARGVMGTRSCRATCAMMPGSTSVVSAGTNFSGRSRRFLLYQYRAADAWPLLGRKEGIEKFNEQLIVGEPSLAPRLVPLPVRMPLPPAEYQGSIYENQRASGRRYFATPDEASRIAAE